MYRRRGSCAGTGKVYQFALFWGKLYSPCLGPLVTGLPGAFEVPASLLCVLAEGKEVQVISKADCNEACLVTELGVETSSVKEEEDRGERRTLGDPSSDVVRRCRLAVEVEAGCAAVEEAANPPDNSEGNPWSCKV